MTSKDPSTDDSSIEEAPQTNALREFASMAIVVGLLGALVYAFVRDQLMLHHAETPLIVNVKTTSPELEALCGANTRDGRPTPISMLYSDDKQRWIEDAAQKFSKLCSNIQVKLTVMDDVSSADAILSGQEKPTLWAPADDLVLSYLDARWKKDRPNDKPQFRPEDRTSLAASPLVGLIWRDRKQVIDRIYQARPVSYGTWAESLCAQVPTDANLDGIVLGDMVPGTWIDWYNPLVPPAPDTTKKKAKAGQQVAEAPVEDPGAIYKAPFPTLDKLRSWGRVKFVHTSPTRSAAGLESIYMMAYDFVLPLKQRSEEAKKFQAEVVADPARRGHTVQLEMLKSDFSSQLQAQRGPLMKWLRRCEAGLEPAPKSTHQLTDAFFNVGPSRYDAVITYEHLAFNLFKQIDEYGGAVAGMELFYPSPTIMNQHPVVMMDGDKLPAEAKRAAEKWIAYLRSEVVQKRAVDYGLRPVNPKVAIREYESEDNPFLKFRRYGVDFESPIVEPPRLDSAAVADLVRIWQDATGRN